MEVVPRDGEAVHLFAGHLDPLLVLGWIDFTGNGQAGRGCCNQLDDGQPAGQGPATPILKNITEEPVLDLVPFRGAGRIVADADGREQQKPWGNSGCGSEWGGLDIVGGHGRRQGGEQIMERTVEGSCSRLQEPELPHGF